MGFTTTTGVHADAVSPSWLFPSVFCATRVGAFALGTIASPADAKACRDSKGKFTKCGPTVMMKKPCRDAKGKFAKCKDAMSAKKM